MISPLCTTAFLHGHYFSYLIIVVILLASSYGRRLLKSIKALRTLSTAFMLCISKTDVALLKFKWPSARLSFVIFSAAAE
jgi:hypothetical protein